MATYVYRYHFMHHTLINVKPINKEHFGYLFLVLVFTLLLYTLFIYL